MKKTISVLLALAMLLTACAALAEGTEAVQNRITGNIVDGCYELAVQLDPEDRGEWRAEESQDGSAVKLAGATAENGVLTVRYEPAGDGEASVSLLHYTEHRTCDEAYSFTLRVEGGKVQESTGGSYQAAPAEEELDPYFSGEWLEKDTQFTTLDVTKLIGDGWAAEFTSPVSHGAWVIRATAYFDCLQDGFVYEDGVKYDLIPGEETKRKEAETGLQGKLQFAGTPENLQIIWTDAGNADGETVSFERAPALPAYSYTGSDPLEGAVAEALAKDNRAGEYRTEPGYVTIPCPIIHRTEMADDTHATVYGSFWILNYVRRGQILHNISGGEYPGIMTLEKAGDEWQVTGLEEAGDGDEYAADIRRFANGDRELEEAYFAAADLGASMPQEIRTRFIREYAEANGLDITAYQDYGWDPVALQ